MVIATRSEQRILNPGWTQQSLFDIIKLAAADAGYTTPYDEYISGTDMNVVYEWVNDNTKTYGKTYLLVRVATTSIRQGIYSNWNAVTHTGTDGTLGNSVSISSASTSDTAQTLSCDAFNGGDEYKCVSVVNGSDQILIGLFMADSPIWNLNLHAKGLIFDGTPSSAMSSVSSRNPFGSAAYVLANGGNAFLRARNRNTNKPDVLRQWIILSDSGEGVACVTSRDLVLGAFANETRYATVSDGNEIFTIISKIAGGIAIRTA